MGIFSKLRGRGIDVTVDKSTAVMIPMVAAMLADGDIDDDEIRQIRAICLCSPIYAKNTEDQDNDIILRAIRMVKDAGADEMCAKASEVLSAGLRDTAFIFATRIVFSDGHVGKKEQAMLERLVSSLGIDEGHAQQMVEVVSIMQHTIND